MCRCFAATDGSCENRRYLVLLGSESNSVIVRSCRFAHFYVAWGAIEPGLKLLLDHPQTKLRVAAVNAAIKPGANPRPLLPAPRLGGSQENLRIDAWRAAAFADEPTSRLAIWARRCAFFALAATVLSILIVRSGILELVPALATFAGALVFAVIGIVLAFGAFVVIWKDGIGGMGHAFAAIGIGCALIAYPAYLGYSRLQAADDQRHHHRRARSAALRRAGAVAAARHRRIRRPLCRRTAAPGLSRHRAAERQRGAAGRL